MLPSDNQETLKTLSKTTTAKTQQLSAKPTRIVRKTSNDTSTMSVKYLASGAVVVLIVSVIVLVGVYYIFSSAPHQITPSCNLKISAKCQQEWPHATPSICRDLHYKEGMENKDRLDKFRRRMLDNHNKLR